MADDLISKIIDDAAIQKQIDALNTTLDTLGARLKTFPTINIGGSATNLKDLQTQSKQYQETVSDLSAAQVKLLAINKEIDAATKAALTAQTKRTVLSTEYGKALTEERVALQKANAEAKTQVQINESATGSLDNLNARLKKLRAEKGSIAPVSPEDIAAIEKLKTAINGLEEERKKLLDDRQAQANNIGNYQGSAKIIVDALEKERLKLIELEQTRVRVQNAGGSFSGGSAGGSNNRTTITGFAGGASPSGIASSAVNASQQLEKLDQQIAQSRTIIEGFSKVTDKPQFLNIASNVGDANKELKFFTKALIDLERSEQGNSEAAIQLRKHLAELTDQIGDAKADIKALSSDIRGFDLFAGSVSFAADAFQLFAGAATLAGASEEDAAEATKTLVAIQSIANGVKGVANELTTRGTAANKLFAFSQLQIKTAMDATATSGARLKAVLLTIGFGAVIVGIGLLIANYGKIKDVLTGATVATKAYTETLDDYKKGAQDAIDKTQKVGLAFDEAKKGVISKDDALKVYNDTLGDTFGKATSLAEAETAYTQKAGIYIKIMGLKAQANALFAKSAEATAAGLVAANEDQVGFLDKFKQSLTRESFFSGITPAQTAQIQADKVKKIQEKSNKDALSLQAAASKAAEEADTLARDNAIKLEPAKDVKEKAKKAAKDKLDVEFEVFKIEQQLRIDQDKAVIDNEKESFNDRLLFLQKYLADRFELINRSEQHEIKAAKGNKDQIKVIEAKFQDERNRLLLEGQSEFEKIRDAKSAESDEKTIDRQKALNERLHKILQDFVDKQSAINDKAAKDKEKKEKEEADRQANYLKQRADLVKQLYSEIQQTIFQFLDDGLKREEQDLDERKRLLEEDTRRRLSNIDQLGLTEIERTKEKAAVEKNAAFQSEQIEKRKRAIEVQRAKFEKAASIASIISGTAQAIVAALKIGPPQGIILAGLVGAIGALQLARAISTPLPKYAKGTDNAKAGLGVTGDGGGRELIISKDGSAFLSPSVPTLTSFIGGEKVLPADMTNSILRAVGIGGLAGMDPKKPITQDNVNNHLLKNISSTLKNIERKSGVSLTVSHDLKASAWYKYHFKN